MPQILLQPQRIAFISSEERNFQELAKLFAKQKELLETLKAKSSTHQIVLEIRSGLERSGISESLFPQNLKEIKNNFLVGKNLNAEGVKAALQNFHHALKEKAAIIKSQTGKNLDEIIDVLKPDCDFEKYVISHLTEKENIRNLLINFCNYTLNVLASKDEKLEELMAGFPPIEENCVPGTSGRIALLLQSRFVAPEDVTSMSAYYSAIARLTASTKNFMHEGNQTHIPFSLDWQLGLKKEARLLGEDKFYKLPAYDMGFRSLILLEEDFRKIFWESVTEDLLGIEKYLAAFPINSADDINQLNQLLERYGLSTEDAYEEVEKDETATEIEYKLKPKIAHKLLQIVSSPLSKLTSQKEDYRPPIASEEEFLDILSKKTAHRIAQTLRSENDGEFLAALKLFYLFGNKATYARSKWQFHNICYALFNDKLWPSLLVQKVAKITDEQTRNTCQGWIDVIAPQFQTLQEKEFYAPFLEMETLGKFSPKHIISAFEEVDNEIILAGIADMENWTPKTNTESLIKIFDNLVTGQTLVTALTLRNSTIKAFVGRPKSALVIEAMMAKVKTSLSAEEKLDPVLSVILLDILMPVTAYQNSPDLFKEIIENKELFSPLAVIEASIPFLESNLGYGAFKGVDGCDKSPKSNEFINHIISYLRHLDETQLNDAELKLFTAEFVSQLLDYMVLKGDVESFKKIISFKLFDIKDLNPIVIKSVANQDNERFIQILKDSGVNKGRFLEGYSFLHTAAFCGKAKLVEEFIKVFAPTKADLNIKSPFLSIPSLGNLLPRQYSALELAILNRQPTVIKALKDSIDFATPYFSSQMKFNWRDIIPGRAIPTHAPIARLAYKTRGQEECLKALMDIMKERLDEVAQDPRKLSPVLSETSQFGFHLISPQAKELARLDKMALKCANEEFRQEFRQSIINATQTLKEFRECRGPQRNITNATATSAVSQSETFLY